MTIPQETEFDPVKYKQDKQAYNYWFRHTFGSEDDDYTNQLYSALYTAIQEELSATSRKYFTAYYFKGLTMKEISEIYSVNKSSVSRTVSRARKKIGGILKYVIPRFAHCFEGTRGEKKNNKSGSRRFAPSKVITRVV